MEDNAEADKADYNKKQKEVEYLANPVMRQMYVGGWGERRR
jgi:heat shock protein 5